MVMELTVFPFSVSSRKRILYIPTKYYQNISKGMECNGVHKIGGWGIKSGNFNSINPNQYTE